MSGLTTDRTDPLLGRGVDESPSEQHDVYLVLSDEERAKGFTRPLRMTYTHVGPPGPTHPLRDLSPEERGRYAEADYVKFEPYPETDSSLVGRYWTREQLDAVNGGCGTETKMGLAIAETYARDPSFYGSTYCSGCQMHRPVAEFRWEDGSQVGS